MSLRTPTTLVTLIIHNCAKPNIELPYYQSVFSRLANESVNQNVKSSNIII